MKHRALIVLIVSLAPALALADDAADHVAKATRYYDIQEWQNALKEYKEAYALDPKPETIWAIAQTQRLSGDCRSAILSYKAYMRSASAGGANAAQEFITKCQADLDAQQRAIDGTGVVTPPPPVGTHPVVVGPPVSPPPPPAPKQPRSWAFDPLGDTLFVVGIGGLAAGITFLTIGDLAMNDAANKPTSGEYDAATSDARTDQRIGTIATIGGAVFTGLAVWRFIAVAGRTKHEQQPTGLTVVPARGGAFASYLVSF